MLLNDRRINFSFGLWLWCHPSNCVKSLPGSAWQRAVSWQKEAERDRVRERTDSSCLMSDRENVILLSQRMNLLSCNLPSHTQTWESSEDRCCTHSASSYEKHIRSRLSPLSYCHREPRCSQVSQDSPLTCNEMVCHPKWIIDNSMVKSWHGGQSQRDPKQQRGHTGHGLGPGHSWLMQLGLSGKWLSKQGPEWLPLTGTSALSQLIHSKEPQSNTQRHTVTSNNTAQSGGTWNESHWPKHGDRRQFAHQIWAQKTVWLRTDGGCGWQSQSNFFWGHGAVQHYPLPVCIIMSNSCVVAFLYWKRMTISAAECEDSLKIDGRKNGNVESKRSRFIHCWIAEPYRQIVISIESY